MNWFYNLRIRQKIMAGFFLVAIIAGIIGYIGIRNIRVIDNLDTELYAKNTVPLEHISHLTECFHRIRVNLRDIILSNDDNYISQKITMNKQLYQEMQNYLTKFENSIQSENARKELDKLKVLQNEFYQVINQIEDLAAKGKKEQALTLIRERAPLVDNFKVEIDNLQDMMVSQAKLKADTNTATANTAVREMLAILSFGVALAIGLGIFITRTITRPLDTVVSAADQIAARNLVINLPPDCSRDELGFLISRFKKMGENLQGEIRQITEGVNVLASSVGEISASTSQLATSSTETAAAVSETTTTMEEVRQTAQAASQKAMYVSEIAQKAAQSSKTGLQSVEETIGEMNKIREQMESIAESIVRLSEQSQAIGEIITTVDDIAEQSNLLAVNASIEAAKAGEQGKGFAVVAQEIKSLAEQSKQATSQVRTILNDIQKATSAAVMVTEQGSKAVDGGVRQSTGANESIRLMSKTISEVSQAVMQIAASAQQQYVGMDQSAMAMENIRQASNQNVDSAKQLEIAAWNLSELGQRLKRIVDQYSI